MPRRFLSEWAPFWPGCTSRIERLVWAGLGKSRCTPNVIGYFGEPNEQFSFSLVASASKLACGSRSQFITILDWRASVSGGIVGVYPGFFPNRTNGGKRGKYKLAKGKMAVTPYFGKRPKGPAVAAGLKRDHVITAVDGFDGDITGRSLLTWINMRYDPGDRIIFSVRDSRGKDSKVSFIVGSREH